MFLFESQIHSLLAVGAGVAIGLPIRYLVIKGTTSLIHRIIARKAH